MSEKKKNLLRQIDDLEKAYNYQKAECQRLSYNNQTLQWQLKQCSEQLYFVETKLREISGRESYNESVPPSIRSLKRSQLMNGSSLTNIQINGFSSPTLPAIEDVIKTEDDVST
ncbi:uncharacterized protein LOC129249279 [Anastrepha obliqua]|uniref:uncharacterized protein LOC129249279 n=1 Tax=Anastrepha obliqua TaxID=95512 RepID=UPI002409FB54|nr:uncharacterized protein LOC129249279 [Anastrepha obliqua]XP_054744966.1 uncharacterized protein LOC129249279 [Anastrepha obliqua]